ncbi:abortive infection family protein [Bradyrhizobium sp. CB82]|uniref:abortive infection family protein n=1 Tax=Bradyrhizobium sp. CB82 TaxID=3039159 RepID=UPI0024B0F98E|nr:abortive infection family protein [Bradyrhizobium sp. CB82]WFU42724.1 abortive infection family protein [Bradyrhizobium sp. CB82]
MPKIAISEITRRNLFDELRLRGTAWAGRLGESDFLGRVFDLSTLPSHDHRQKTMAGDIWMHRENFRDWDDDWVYDDNRLKLLHCPDEKFLSFLCEMIHPLVRQDEREIEALRQVFNRHLGADGYEVAAHTYISGKAIYAARPIAAGVLQIAAAREIADELASDHVAALITRIEAAVEADPALAIGSAKEFVESICKGILSSRGLTVRAGDSLPQLVKATRDALNLSGQGKTGDTLRQVLSSLSTITQGIAELRGQLGSGHGHHPSAARPLSSVARLSVNTAIALGVFLYETHREMSKANDVFGLLDN